ncbi:MAG: hypothetical protein QNK98_07205 [Yoonia sp.]|jgi:hypothetical protein|tara:strand:+ start:122 stop:379 length:258 start_codon:yes stop_codon:yes gene_type:complete
MLKKIKLSLAIMAATSTAAMACTSEDVQSRQGVLVAAMQILVVVDKEKAQTILSKMQQDMDQAAADGDEAAVCTILDEALATAQS